MCLMACLIDTVTNKQPLAKQPASFTCFYLVSSIFGLSLALDPQLGHISSQLLTDTQF